MPVTLTLYPGRLVGEIAAMPSKYDLHRLMIAAHLAGMDLEGLPIVSEDIGVTKRCLLSHAECLTLNAECAMDCRESGSTLRFLLPVMAALGRAVAFAGAGRLPERPLRPLIDLLRDHGCAVTGDRLPLTISGQLRPGVFALPGNVSSQYVTGLLFALPLLCGDSEIALTSPLESAGYAAMTLRTLEKFGIAIEETKNGWRVPGPQAYLPLASSRLTPDADWGSAAFWLAANALGSDVRVKGLDDTTPQPDRAITELLAHPAAMDASQCPDLAPVMAVVMALTPGEHRIMNAARLRLKESDRLAAMAQNLNALGGRVEELPDELIIRGVSRLHGGPAQSFGDHRIAMAMAIAALRCDGPLTLEGAECVRKSYPRFWEDYARLMV